MKNICYSLQVALDETGHINPAITLQFVLGILSSTLLMCYARSTHRATHIRGGGIEVRVSR
jgi:hypothetical protein